MSVQHQNCHPTLKNTFSVSSTSFVSGPAHAVSVEFCCSACGGHVDEGRSSSHLQVGIATQVEAPQLLQGGQRRHALQAVVREAQAGEARQRPQVRQAPVVRVCAGVGAHFQ